MTIELSDYVPTRASPSTPGVSIHTFGTRTLSLAFSKPLTSDQAPEILARGHAQGITLLRPIIFRTYRLRFLCEIYAGSATKLVKVLRGSQGTFFVVSVHADYSVRSHIVKFENSEVNIDQIAILTGTSGHAAPVSCLDASMSGTIIWTATSSDDNTLIIARTDIANGENSVEPRAYRLACTGSDIVFLPESVQSRTKVAVLEGTSRIRVFDCVNGSWLLSIYPGFATALSSFAVSSGKGAAIVAILDKGWRVYKGVTYPEDEIGNGVRGGSGYTYPSDQGLFRGKEGSKTVEKVIVAVGKVVAKVGVGEEGGVGVFDLGSSNEFGTHVPVMLTSSDISVAAVSEDGRAVAVACGAELFLVTLGREDEVGMDTFEEDSVVYNDRLPIDY
ncbi:uncharacterized protein V1513DRAFT_438975 [Lipomyces chichibuensis]|uniref:uncharacterized protein n=1 Tax=Lipomyces chichibuensis TaxID=1546026 RepID=UPI0033440A51